MNAILERIKEIFGGAQPLGASPSTTDEWRVLVEHGIPTSALDALSRLVGNDEDQARRVVSIVLGADGNIENPPHERLSVSESERAERIARIFALAEACWAMSERLESSSSLPIPSSMDHFRSIGFERNSGAARSSKSLSTYERGFLLNFDSVSLPPH